MPDKPQPPKNLFRTVVGWFTDAAAWIQENMGAPELASTIRADLGLNPDSNVNAPAFSHVKDLDPDKEAFAETVAMLKPLAEEFIAFGEAIKGGGLSGWDAAYLVSRVAATDTMRLSAPALYALAKLTLFISDDPDAVEALTPQVFIGLLNGKGFPDAASTRFINLLSDSGSLLILLLEKLLKKFDAVVIDSYYGWDPSPGSASPLADEIAARALTVVVSRKGIANTETVGLTVIGVPVEHQGPGLVLGLSGDLKLEPLPGPTSVTFEATAASGACLFIPLRGGDPGFTLLKSDPTLSFKTGLVRKGDGGPIFRLGSPTGTRFEAGAMRLGVDVSSDGAGVSFRLDDAALIINIGEEGFLRQLQREELKIDLSMGFSLSTRGGFRLDGGSALRVSLPVGRTIGGIFTIFSMELELGPGANGRDLGLVFTGGFSLKLGPFKGTVDRMGMRADLAFHEGNLGFMDIDLGFRPPKGIGLSLDAGIVKGGGYLFIDPERGRYAGALELKLGPIGVKAVAIISTKMPDGTEGWSLLLLVYTDFPPIQLSFGFVLSAVGGMIGLQHGMDLEGIRTGLSSGMLNDVLFPKDPVGDAPRLINTLLTVFPPQKYSLTIGPMVELGWGTPLILAARLGLLLQLDNVLGGDRPVSLSKITIIGVLTADLPFRNEANLAILHLECDFVGYLDFDNQRLGFEAVLRNSHILGVLELFGGLAIYLSFGDSPDFILSAGGLYPGFDKVPAGFKAPPRLGASFGIGLVRTRVEIYFAVTPATIQAGAKVDIYYGISDIAEVHGRLGFEAICRFNPFHFTADIHALLEVSAFGETFAGLYLDGHLEGPGHWIIDGTARLHFLLWDVPLNVHEEWGTPPPELPPAQSVARLLGEAVSARANWSVQVPATSESFVTLGAVDAADGLLAHPLGTMQFSQKVAPLGLTLEKFGSSKIDGPDRFDLQGVNMRGVAAVGSAIQNEFFARSQFLNLSPEQCLSDPEFEPMPAGIRVGNELFTVPTEVLNAAIDFETGDYDDQARGALFHLSTGVLAVHAASGAAARSDMRSSDALKPSAARAASTKIRVVSPTYAAVDTQRMAAIDGVSVPAAGAESKSLVRQSLAVAGKTGQVVEAFELLARVG